MTPNTPPPPGSDAAIQFGCTCPVLDNAHGKGYMGVAGVYVFSGDCPLHNPQKHQECCCEPAQDTAPRHPMDYSLGCPIHWQIRIDYEKARDRYR